MKTKTVIGITFQVEGFHCWPEAPDEVGFLRERHRHIFHFTCTKEVMHDDRDTEFILLKRRIEETVRARYEDRKTRACEFGSKSCEMLAKELLLIFDLTACKVSEDNENFAIVR